MPDALTHVTFLMQSKVREKALKSLREGPIQASSVAEQLSAARSTIDRLLVELLDWEWAERRTSAPGEPDTYALTPAGSLGWRAIMNAFERVGRDEVRYLTKSERRIRVLRLLISESVTITELSNRPWLSQPTAYRTLSGFNERGWTQREEPTDRYSLTASGERVHREIDRLLVAVEWIIENTEALQFLGEVVTSLPIDPLPETTVISETPGNPDRVLNYYDRQLSATDNTPLEFKGITPIVSSRTYSLHAPYINAGSRVEVVIDEAVLNTLQVEYPDLYDRLPEHETIDLHVYPERLGFGLIIFESRALVVGYQGNARKVCIESSDESFVEWALELFDRYREASRPLDKAFLSDFSEEED